MVDISKLVDNSKKHTFIVDQGISPTQDIKTVLDCLDEVISSPLQEDNKFWDNFEKNVVPAIVRLRKVTEGWEF